MSYVYIVKCKDNTLYTGFTTDIERRITEHNNGVGSKYTKGRRPVKLVYLEEFDTKGEAMSREYEIKTFSREKKLSLIKTGGQYEEICN
jgi:putative endonuclease